ncbi:teichoic acid ABC transporter ATP-binding protein [Candidatus Roizmanbacteria bacterium CG09_land_8_20_14_0_10_41_9]|uniref:Teichoic acid ABC transporter ATP-binding protein n=1 Tax=Candidatus Roizmanbacteria bacterium CG09_land_8_20_14_0_10_41_9 TaxID=1974850 RepID=A0A2H0WT73_9BACT|nr:MAG: teichoic acid ABC transporter ATP-binding protein [Candidatus Roizmanbacteria bacterium CG09_land_8_20_14_0_10_41_9]
MDPNVIVLKNVEKYFFLQHQKTLKELVQALFKKQKTLEQVHALKSVSFTIQKGESVGIIGRNGAGKSTLLKLIAGVSVPTSGSLTVNGKVVPLIELGAGFHSELTGRENIYLNGVILGLKESYIKSKLKEIIEFSEIEKFIDIPIKYFSSGMQMRLAFSVAVFVDPEILLIDEILAVGDIEFKEKCLKKMEEFKKRGVTIVFVSHSMENVENFCERVIYMKEGKIEFDGDTKRGIDLYLK